MLIIEKFLLCDHCSAEWGVDDRQMAIPGKTLREEARKDGWKCKGAIDICPKCVKQGIVP